MPSGRRPASRTAASSRWIMSRWAATSTTRWRWPSGVSTIPSAWKSSTALLSGIGTWSCAWKRTAASISLRSSTGGKSSVRSTVRWLATPRRTRLLRPPSLNSSRSVSASTPSSSTSPSRTMSAGNGASAACLIAIEPLTCACTAATWPGWMSRPTTSAPPRRPSLRLKLMEGACICMVRLGERAVLRSNGRTIRTGGIGAVGLPL
jgi:hypothetical protein